MSKSISRFGVAIASLAAGLCIATTSNAQSPQSPMSDAAYCQLLANTLSIGAGGRGREENVSTETAVAIAQCQDGNPGSAIPVLQQKLRDNDIPVPSRS